MYTNLKYNTNEYNGLYIQLSQAIGKKMSHQTLKYTAPTAYVRPLPQRLHKEKIFK